MCFSFFIIDNARNRRIRQTLMTFLTDFVSLYVIIMEYRKHQQ